MSLPTQSLFLRRIRYHRGPASGHGSRYTVASGAKPTTGMEASQSKQAPLGRLNPSTAY